MQPSRSHGQSGSAFFIILIGIFLFAGLSYAIMQGSRTSEANLTREQARLAAQEIISYGDSIQKAVQTLRLRGCEITQLSFVNDGTSKMANNTAYVYTNASAPADGSCDVFGLQGGKVIPQLVSSGHINPSLVAATDMHAQSYKITATRVEGQGSDSVDASGTDMLLWVGRLRPEVCMEINNILNVDNLATTPPIDSFACQSWLFDGTFTACAADPLGEAPELAGKTAFCSGDDASGTTYSYYRLLLIR